MIISKDAKEAYALMFYFFSFCATFLNTFNYATRFHGLIPLPFETLLAILALIIAVLFGGLTFYPEVRNR